MLLFTCCEESKLTVYYINKLCMCQTMAAMCIYAHYFCVVFSCAFYVSICFSQLFLSLQSFSLVGSDFKSSPEQFPSLEAKAVCIVGSVLMDEAGTSFFFSPCCN